MGRKLLLDKAHIENIRLYDVYRREGGYRSVEKALKTMSPYIGRDVTYADLRAIARKAEEIYRRAGYPFVAVVVLVFQRV